MSRAPEARPATRGTHRAVAVGLFLAAAILGSVALSSPLAVSDLLRGEDGSTTDGVVTEDDGTLPAGVTVFDDRYPGVTHLDPDLLQALRDAATEAADDDVGFVVNSGWRSPEYQDQLLREAVAEYGSAEEAARWVATAATSLHVSGDAVDIGPPDAAAWLSEHGADHGLCQVYGNEPWHFELRSRAVEHGCRDVYDDPTQDPRLQQ